MARKQPKLGRRQLWALRDLVCAADDQPFAGTLWAKTWQQLTALGLAERGNGSGTVCGYRVTAKGRVAFDDAVAELRVATATDQAKLKLKME